MDAILQFDSSMLLWIQDSVRSDFLTPVMKVITHLGDKGILWILLTIALICFRKTRKMGMACLISMVIGLMPVTGIPLPFVSYGGSSYLTNIIGVGLVVNVTMRSRAGVARQPRPTIHPKKLIRE